MPDNEHQSIMLRTATVRDAEALLAIYAYYVEHTAVTFEYDVPTPDEFRHRIEHTLQRYPYIVAVQVIEGTEHIVGYAYASPLGERAAYQWAACSSIYLDHSIRHHGLGSILQTALEDSLKAQGIRNLYACITTADSTDEHLSYDSPHFHSHMGFTEVGHFHCCGYKFNRWYDVLWMEKRLLKSEK